MEYTKHLMQTRALGEKVPLSISTAMIFESENADYKKWEPHIHVNVITIIRNLLGSCNQPLDWAKLDPLEIIPELINELIFLQNDVPMYRGDFAVTFYFPDYSKLPKQFPKGHYRKQLTERQQYEEHLIEAIRAEMLSQQKENKLDVPVQFIDTKLNKDSRLTTLITSFPTDLMSQYQFPKLTLLETHTGRIKSRRMWYTKLNPTGDEDMSKIPFNKFTLQVFGDGKQLLSAPLKLKRAVVMMSVKNRWNSLTTEERIRQSISRLPEEYHEVKTALLDYL